MNIKILSIHPRIYEISGIWISGIYSEHKSTGQFMLWVKYFCIRISLKFVPKGPIDNKSALVSPIRRQAFIWTNGGLDLLFVCLFLFLLLLLLFCLFLFFRCFGRTNDCEGQRHWAPHISSWRWWFAPNMDKVHVHAGSTVNIVVTIRWAMFPYFLSWQNTPTMQAAQLSLLTIDGNE